MRVKECMELKWLWKDIKKIRKSEDSKNSILEEAKIL